MWKDIFDAECISDCSKLSNVNVECKKRLPGVGKVTRLCYG